MSAAQPVRTSLVVIHPLAVRVTHWLNAVAIVCMAMSGWKIYNASPLFGFSFPGWATLGGWLGGAIAWHLAAMWLLVANAWSTWPTAWPGGTSCAASCPSARARLAGFEGGAVLPPGPQARRLQRRAAAAVRRGGAAGRGGGGVPAFGLWKPVQLQDLVGLLGGVRAGSAHPFRRHGGHRRLHRLCILALVAIVPSTLWAMVTGRARVEASAGEVRP